MTSDSWKQMSSFSVQNLINGGVHEQLCPACYSHRVVHA